MLNKIYWILIFKLSNLFYQYIITVCKDKEGKDKEHKYKECKECKDKDHNLEPEEDGFDV
jgi:hypothetical protein